MEKKAASAIVPTLLLIGMLTFAFSIQPVAASVTVHNIDTGEDFATIQGAIDDHDTIMDTQFWLMLEHTTKTSFYTNL